MHQPARRALCLLMGCFTLQGQALLVDRGLAVSQAAGLRLGQTTGRGFLGDHFKIGARGKFGALIRSGLGPLWNRMAPPWFTWVIATKELVFLEGSRTARRLPTSRRSPSVTAITSLF